MEKLVKQAKKTSKFRRLWLNIGKLILDGTKLCFGSLVLGAAIRGGIPTATLMFTGIIASASGAIIGVSLLTVFEEQ